MLGSFPRSLITTGTGSRSSTTIYNGVLRAINKLEIENHRNYSFTGDIVTPSRVLGIDHLRDPRLNKGLAFTLEERLALGIHGLQPPRFKTMEEQLELCKLSIERYSEDLNKYLYLTELSDRNEKLFYRLLAENLEELMPIVYTPTVGLACQRFGLIYRRPRGLFITINDRGHCYDVLKNWPEPNIRAVCVTDGERILGLGDLGANGMGIPVGKLSLYTALGGIKPHQCLPILLDVGTNNQKLLEDPTYIGLRQRRVVGSEYEDFVEEFMEAVVKRYGQNTLIQFEDFANHTAFRFLDKFRGRYCVFNDDIQGTASVVLAGLLACKRVTNKSISANTFMFFGAGEAAIGIADLCVRAMQAEGLSEQDARDKIWMMDVDGLLAHDRPAGKLEGHKVYYAKRHTPTKDFKSLVEEVKPSILIGASAVSGAFSPDILKIMKKNNERPIIFALSNPTSKAECTAEEAYIHTEGTCVFASGSPFPPVTYNGVTYKTGQGNNAYIFPGIALGVIETGMYHIGEDIFVIAAQTVADNVSKQQLETGSVYPLLRDCREVSMQIATKISEYAYDKGLASVYPEPVDKRAHVESLMYNFQYESALPVMYDWPPPPEIVTKPMEPVVLHGPRTRR